MKRSQMINILNSYIRDFFGIKDPSKEHANDIITMVENYGMPPPINLSLTKNTKLMSSGYEAFKDINNYKWEPEDK